VTTPSTAPSAARARSIWRYLLWDAAHRLRRPLAPSVVAVLTAFAATMAIFATTGLAVASQQRAIEVIDSPAGRLVTISDPQGTAGLSPATVSSLARLSGVDWVLGVGVAREVRNARMPFGSGVPSRLVFGDISAAVDVDAGQLLRAGDALVAPGVAETLGLAEGVGAVRGRGVEGLVVAGFTAREPLASLADHVLVVADPDISGAQVTTLWVSVDDVAQLPRLARAVRAAAIADEPAAIQVDTVEELAMLSQDVTASLAESARWTLLGLLTAVALLIGALQFGRVSGLVRDIGRTRALGGTRTIVLVQMLLNGGLCAAAGALGGTVCGAMVTWAVAGTIPSVSFLAAIPALVVLAALAGTLIPALRASRMDPVAILRVP
jgi:putative ABC transport system permease protein